MTVCPDFLSPSVLDRFVPTASTMHIPTQLPRQSPIPMSSSAAPMAIPRPAPMATPRHMTAVCGESAFCFRSSFGEKAGFCSKRLIAVSPQNKSVRPPVLCPADGKPKCLSLPQWFCKPCLHSSFPYFQNTELFYQMNWRATIVLQQNLC